jgi:hypothetical protein
MEIENWKLKMEESRFKIQQLEETVRRSTM